MTPDEVIDGEPVMLAALVRAVATALVAFFGFSLTAEQIGALVTLAVILDPLVRRQVTSPATIERMRRTTRRRDSGARVIDPV